MSSTGGKIMSPTSHVKHNSILGRAPSGSGPLVRSSLPVTNYSICHMRSPMVQCVKLNIPNGNSYKTDVEREIKTDLCIQKSVSVKINDDSENASLPSSDKTSENTITKMNTSEDQTTIIPDSTTNQPETKQAFNCGDDVFVQQKDGRYYLGTVIKTESGGDRWLVRFGDNTERWAVSSELRPLSSPGGADAPAMCVVCKLSGNGRSEEVIACDKCSRGYHPDCHSPPVTSSIKGASWHCRRCVDQRFKVAAAHNRALRKAEMSKIKQNHKPLPYDVRLRSLHWDPQHRTNTENIYCYCGEAGDWFAQMLQCARCKQWFHQNCIPCLKYPLYTGDRFYMFVCSLCNFGSEFLRRIEMKWVDLVHLVLFNLTMFHSKKYFDLDTTVIPYTASNWYALQLPLKMQTTTPSERREQILSALSNNGNRFKCGREIKKRTTIWGLRKRTPPPPPTIPTAPLPRGPISDQALANRWGRLGLAFIPQQQDHTHNSADSQQHMIVPADHHWQSLMMGKQFQSSSGSDAESQRSTPSPMLLPDIPSGYQPSSDFNVKSNFLLSKKYKEEGVDSDASNDDLPLVDIKPTKQKEYKFYEMDYQCGGFVKKSVPFPKSVLSKRGNAESSTKDIFSKRIKKRRETYSCRDLKRLDNDEAINKSKKKLRKSLARQEKNNLRTASTSTNTLHLHEDSSLRLLENDISKDGSSTYGSSLRLNEVVLPPTPPTSMSAPPTPPAISGPSSYSNLSDVSCDYQASQSISKKVDCSYDSDMDLADFKDDKCTKSIMHDRKLKIHIKEKSPVKIEKSQSDDESAKMNLRLNTSKTFTNNLAINLEISKLSTKNIIEHSKIMSLHHMKSDDMYSIYSHNKLENDSSGDDTSSRGTLDSIIPPPVNFQGANNPFHSVNNAIDQNKNTLFGNVGTVKGNSMTNKLFNRNKPSSSVMKKHQRISLPVSLNPVIQPGVKLLKRQLSEKDLIIGPNGEVKRRRHRRTKLSVNNQNNQAVSKDINLNERQKSLRSSLGQEEPTKNATAAEVIQQISARLDTSAKSRCLRQRQEKNYCDGRRGSTSSTNGIGSIVRISNIAAPTAQLISNINPGMSSVRSLNLSPQKNDQWNVPDDIQDLKSSVHSYFGAPNRIAAGEKFTLAGKRLTESGKLQYLIEWEGHGS